MSGTVRRNRALMRISETFFPSFEFAFHLKVAVNNNSGKNL
jgi:hypothetical protein